MDVILVWKLFRDVVYEIVFMSFCRDVRPWYLANFLEQLQQIQPELGTWISSGLELVFWMLLMRVFAFLQLGTPRVLSKFPRNIPKHIQSEFSTWIALGCLMRFSEFAYAIVFLHLCREGRP